jgi:DNA-binding response OmpR family regulator
MAFSPVLLLISEDEELATLICGLAKPPWRLVCRAADTDTPHSVLGEAHVRVVVFDDQAVEENARDGLLAQIARFFSGVPLLYVTATQSDANEKRARMNGAHYYISKPLPIERFTQVLRSFLKTHQETKPLKQLTTGSSTVSATESTSKNPNRTDAWIQRLSQELNREDSYLKSSLLDAALAGLRLTRSPESLELRRDAARICAVIRPLLSHHLDAEDNQSLPWLDQQGRLSPELGRRVRECHDKLGAFSNAVSNSATEHLTETQTRDLGRTLSALAVHLDDAIDSQERKLLPTLRQALFACAGLGVSK